MICWKCFYRSRSKRLGLHSLQYGSGERIASVRQIEVAEAGAFEQRVRDRPTAAQFPVRVKPGLGIS